MFQYLYEWTQNLVFYMVLVTVVLHTVPDLGYNKYIRFYTGMVLILMIVTPVFRIFGMDSQITNFYKSREYEAKLEEIEGATDFLDDIDTLGLLENIRTEAEDLESSEITQKDGGATKQKTAKEGDYVREQKDDSIRVEEIQIEREKETD